ncbi:MAG: DUF559 domain-containing protein [Myxococcales bacterium]
MGQTMTTQLVKTPKAAQGRADPRMPAKRARQRLWRSLRASKLGGVEFTPYQPLGAYTVDFFAPELKLAVEVDEPRDLFTGDRDLQRQAQLQELGVRCVRLQAEDVGTDVDGCIQRIAEAIRTIRDLS